MLDEQSGERPASHNQMPSVAQNEGLIYGHYNSRGYDGVGKCDSGGASRFFYCAKASRAEREAGLEGCEATMPRQVKPNRLKCRKCGGWQNVGGATVDNRPHSTCQCAASDYAEETGRVRETRNHHPTVKPLALLRYLLTLFDTPTGGRVLDPFLGSGSTMVACVQLGRDCVGIEREPEYAEIARKRTEAATRQGKLFAHA